MLKSTKVLARREFDRGLAQSLGVVALFLLDETSGTMRDLMTGNSVGIGSQTITVGSDETGNVLKFDGGTASAQRLALPLPVPSGASGNLQTQSAGFVVMGRFKPTAAPVNSPGQFFGVCASSGTQGSIGIAVDTSLNVGMGFLSGATNGTICTVAGSVGNFYTVYATSNGSSGSAWINGQPSGSQGTALSAGGAGTFDEIVFGGMHRSSGFLRQAKGNLEWGAVIYGVPMTDDLAKTLYASDFPYNLFKRRRSPWKVAAAAGGTFTQTTSLDAAIQRQGLTKTASFDAAIRVSRTATAQADAAIRAASSATASLDAALRAPRSSTASLDFAVQAARSAAADVDAAVRLARSLGVSVDAFVQSGTSLSAQLDAAVRFAATRTVGADAAIQAARSLSASLDAAVAVGRSVSASLDAALALRIAASSQIDAAVRAALSHAVALDAYVNDPNAARRAPTSFSLGARATFAVPGRSTTFTVH